MLWSRAMIHTLREDPQEAEIPSHKLMLRAGLIRRLSGGLYTFMPLGLRALQKVEQIVREEMNRAGALEVLMPALQPREIWDQSERYEKMGDGMFRLQDRQQRDFVLGPTHEEVITDLVAREISSHKQLPVTLYQIQTKFRDEIRPRFGLMRAKEFIMKDAYSFDLDWDQADRSYEAMYQAYKRIFARCGLRTKVVEADTGAMGGNWSHEFMVPAESGEDGILECTACSYAANLEKAERKAPTPACSEHADKLPEAVHTPGARTIAEVAAMLDCPTSRLIKTLIYLLNGEPIAVCLPGDRELNEHKLRAALMAESLEPAGEDLIQQVTGAPIGFAGPVGLSLPVYADTALQGVQDMIAGANQADTHLLHVTPARDVDVTQYLDLVLALAGDACPRCGAPLTDCRGIEVGHVFKLGTKYTEAFHAGCLDDQGKTRTMVMGCYGIGVSRTLQALIEQSHDANGILWPVSIAPYPVVLLCLAPDQQECLDESLRLAGDIEAAGLDVLIDDRAERPGVKFKDADLIGFPLRLVVSPRSLAKGQVEIRLRDGRFDGDAPLDQAAGKVYELLTTTNDS